jgi:predicted phosphohydrolase
MPKGPSIAVTADLHWGHHDRGNAAVRLLVEFLRGQPPDLLLLAGDIGSGARFSECLALFDDLTCTKALVAGNHDIWVTAGDSRGDSLQVYQHLVPELSKAHGFHYLDTAPLLMREFDVAIAGSINWYDYSWALEEVRRQFPAEEWRLAAKRFTRGQHNDARFVRWDLDDEAFTRQIAAALEKQFEDVLERAGTTILVTHHPPIRDLSFPQPPPPHDIDQLLWAALMGNRAVEELIARHASRLALTFCGHIHRAREAAIGPGRGFNVGGDYHFKRLLWFDSPDEPAVAHQFGNPVR